jgi:uncharacterized damage-inducible protein DinB
MARRPSSVESTFPSLLEEALESWQGVRGGLIDEVENLPESCFDFRPSPGMRSVREVVQHVLEVSLMMAGELGRPDTNFHRAPWRKLLDLHAAQVRRAKTKRDLLSLLRASRKEGEKRFRRFGELMMLQLITRFDGKRGTRLAWLHHGIEHEAYHTGQLTAYARALGITPALTRQIEG